MSKEEIISRLQEVLIKRLRVPMEAGEITPTMPLFSEEGVGLDSVDSMEIVAAINEFYGVALTNEDREYFKNLDTLSTVVLERME
jgi:acyl carrier protein